jgi:hypothetical protein
MDVLEPTSLYVPPCLALQNSTFCPHSAFMCFVWISEQTAVISLYNFNWLVFITETDSVYCAVRTESLYIIQGDAWSVVNKVALGQVLFPFSPDPSSGSKLVAHNKTVSNVCVGCDWKYWWILWLLWSFIQRFPRPYNSINTPYSSSATYCSCQKDKSANPRNLQKSNSIREIWEQWTEQYLVLKEPIVCTFYRSILILFSRFERTQELQYPNGDQPVAAVWDPWDPRTVYKVRYSLRLQRPL